mmetsp:Transcript_20425/g.34021  ORF Transcript_20425/g.34021 Transcript_20425/m.34021 type:complete len:204 (-) Transcript_20425:28-639(-)
MDGRPLGSSTSSAQDTRNGVPPRDFRRRRSTSSSLGSGAMTLHPSDFARCRPSGFSVPASSCSAPSAIPTKTEDSDEVPNKDASVAAASTITVCRRSAASTAPSAPSSAPSAVSQASLASSVQRGEVGSSGSSWCSHRGRSLSFPFSNAAFMIREVLLPCPISGSCAFSFLASARAAFSSLMACFSAASREWTNSLAALTSLS